MPAFFEGLDGPAKGRRIELKPGQGITVGRGEATFTVPEDQSMSPLHFHVGQQAGSLRLQNLSTAHPTQVNGAAVETAILQPGDKIQAGQTVFLVHGPAPSPFPAQVRLGGWGFEFVPAGWDTVEGAGFRLSSDLSFGATMTAVEEPLPAGQTLAEYMQTQLSLMRSQIPGVTAQDPAETKIRGAEQAVRLVVITPGPNGLQVISRQIYALSGGTVGIFTATLLDRQQSALQDPLSRTEQGLSYFQG